MSKPKSEKFFDAEKNVKEYIESRAGLDGSFLIEILKKHLKPGSTILELGIGTGTDLDILSKTYKTCGSDNSRTFLDLYKQKNPAADLILLDAATLKTDKKFDCIYSNKVLHHLSKEHLKNSLKSQKDLLNPDGILFHTFWLGENEAEFQDLKFIQYKIDKLEDLVRENFEIVEIEKYAEINIDDSVYLMLRVKDWNANEPFAFQSKIKKNSTDLLNVAKRRKRLYTNLWN